MGIYGETSVLLFYFHSSNSVYIEWSTFEVITLFKFVDGDITM